MVYRHWWNVADNESAWTYRFTGEAIRRDGVLKKFPLNGRVILPFVVYLL